MSIFPNSFVSDFGHSLLHIPRRESSVQVILTLNHYPEAWSSALWRYLDWDHLTELYLSWMRCRHCTATTRQQRISFCIFTVRTILLLTPASQKGVLYFYFEWNLWSEAMFFNFMIALSSTSSSHGRLKWHKPSTLFAKIVSLDISFSRYPILFYFTKLYTRIRGHISKPNVNRLTNSSLSLEYLNSMFEIIFSENSLFPASVLSLMKVYKKNHQL